MDKYQIIDKICLLVSEFNYLFGVIDFTYSPDNSGILVDKFNSTNMNFNQKQVELRYKLIKEESDELNQAFEQKNVTEIIDALCDILYVVAGAKVYFNLPNKNIGGKIKSENLVIKDKIVNNINLFEIIELILEDKNNIDELNIILNSIMCSNNKLNELTNNFIKSNNQNEINKKIDEYNDVLDDIIYQVMKISFKFGINIYDLFVLVHESNMTKVCVDLETAIRSIDYYKTIEKRYSKPAYKEIIFNAKQYWVIYDEETKKILKSIDYKPVNFFI